jgi:hypothetical protein
MARSVPEPPAASTATTRTDLSKGQRDSRADPSIEAFPTARSLAAITVV